jgi:Recombination endonuclease VII
MIGGIEVPYQNNEKQRQYFKDYHKRNKTKRAQQARFRFYGITEKEFDIVLESQSHKCAICGSNEPEGKGWNVDHSHRTKQVRGILCFPCNIMLGFAKDNPQILRDAANYLETTYSVFVC